MAIRGSLQPQRIRRDTVDTKSRASPQCSQRRADKASKRSLSRAEPKVRIQLPPAVANLRFLRKATTPRFGAVEFSVGVGEYEGTVRVSRRVFQSLLDQSPTPERCMEAYHLHRTRLELIAERKLRRRQLTDDGNVEITGRDLKEREVRAHLRRRIGYDRAAS
jgi:hypothetical protein